MLKPREADIPALFMVLVVLPVAIYVILGKWNDNSKKAAKANILARIAAEESYREEEILASVDVLPVVPLWKIDTHVCAKCYAPATSRCSRCKSVGYCSGKCQIVHWRQAHKQECQQWKNGVVNITNSILRGSIIEGSRDFIESYTKEPQHVNAPSDSSDQPSFWRTDASIGPHTERILSDNGKKNFQGKPKRETSSDDSGIIIGAVNTSAVVRLADGHSTDTLLQDALFEAEFQSGPGHLTNLPEKALDVLQKSTRTTTSSFKQRKPAGSHEKSASRSPRQCQSQAETRKCFIYDESRIPPSVPTSSTEQSSKGMTNTKETTLATSRSSLKNPKSRLVGLINGYRRNKVLFPYEDIVKLFQCEVSGISPRGLLNCGNSCYANAVLQCLTFTKPIMVYLLHRSHSRTCRMRDWCLMCELEQHIAELMEGGRPLSPNKILLNMSVGCRMGGGNQEDAHEFLRLLVMSMQAVCLWDLGGEKKVDPGLQETTLVQQIFGGRLKSKVKCLRCHHESERYENILDLTLEIYGWVESLEDALTQFTSPEDLDGENMYKCGRCSAYVRARKQLSLHEVPNILTIVLKRFKTGKYGKINKCVTFPDLLDMIPFVAGTADSPPLYMLYAVVVHLDTLNTSFSGHYVSYVKDIQGVWFRIDDSEVQAVPLSQVMSEGAYMLFYSRSFPRPPTVCINRALLQTPSLKHNSLKSLKPSSHGQPEEAEHRGDHYNDKAKRFFPSNEISSDKVGTDFSDPTSSDWSLFTSSDESSFTTESTRNSFSTVDHEDSTGLDPISSIFGSFYLLDCSQHNAVSCTSSSLRV